MRTIPVEAILDEAILVNESGCAFHSKAHGSPNADHRFSIFREVI
jgi:hypothetical protein